MSREALTFGPFTSQDALGPPGDRVRACNPATRQRTISPGRYTCARCRKIEFKMKKSGLGATSESARASYRFVSSEIRDVAVLVHVIAVGFRFCMPDWRNLGAWKVLSSDKIHAWWRMIRSIWCLISAFYSVPRNEQQRQSHRCNRTCQKNNPSSNRAGKGAAVTRFSFTDSGAAS